MAMNRRRFVQAAGAGAGMVLAGGAGAFHDRIHEGYSSLQPAPGEIENLRILGFCDFTYNGVPGKVGGWDRTYEFQYREGYLYCGHQIGFSIVDARDVGNMHVIFRHQNESPAPDNTQYIDMARGDNVLVQKRNDRLVMWDVSNPYAPTILSSFTPPGILVTNPGGGVAGSFGFHGLWVHTNAQGRFACASVRLTGYTDQILIVVNITDPRNPREQSRWWYPGQWTAGGEVATWPSDAAIPGRTGTPVQMHDLTTWGDRAYIAWRQKGLIILDFSDMLSRPVKIGEINWGDVSRPLFNPLAAATHSIGLVIPHRGGPIQTVVAGDEVGRCPGGYAHVIDVRNERRPQEISSFETPFNRGGNCPYDRNLSRSAIHDMERHTRGDIVWAAWEEGGVWGIDLSDIHRPKPAGWFIAPARSDAGRVGSSHADDVNVDWQRKIIFASGSDNGAGGVTALRHVPGFRGTVTWDAEERDLIFRRSHDPVVTY